MDKIVIKRQQLFTAKANVSWASEMVLNPGVVKDPATGRLHMLFRATGPCAERKLQGKPNPYPIFLGYAWSDDDGQSWTADWTRPALSPALAYEPSEVKIQATSGKQATNYSNGCIEDPRLFHFEGACYAVLACRMFPPGPYWENDEPTQCAPAWAVSKDKNPYGKAASENVTVNVLYKVDLSKLSSNSYEAAFSYVTHLTDPEFGEDRDVMFFPERIGTDAARSVVMLQRPWKPSVYPGITEEQPSIVVARASRFEDFALRASDREVAVRPRFVWEGNRIGASCPPVKVGTDLWLLNYHGKQDAVVGYTQSFIIMSTAGGSIEVLHRCPDRVLYAKEPWEMPGKFKAPVVFSTGLIMLSDGNLLISYGAADERVGIAFLRTEELLAHVRRFGPNGEPL